MASDLEGQKKVLLPILQRASEIESIEPRMAYYCRLYALKRALELDKPAKEITGLIKALFDQCEKDKPKVQPVEEADRAYCESFALTVFRRADRMDRAGKADINTAKCYYAAAIFLQVMEQFLGQGEDMEVVYPDLVEKARYAVWRAAELRRAMREGRPPAPPPEPVDAAAAMAAAGEGGDPFSGPAFDGSAAAAAAGAAAGGAAAAEAAPHRGGSSSGGGGGDTDAAAPPHLPAGGAAASGDSTASAAYDLLSLPRPPSTTVPAGCTGLLEPAVACGPRFKPGSLVWAVPHAPHRAAHEPPASPPLSPSAAAAAAAAAVAGARPVRGTVGQLVGADAGAGGQALYKVALAAAIEEFSDSQLAPVLGAGERVMFVEALGDLPQPASIVAVQADAWPCTYLLQLDNGRNLAAAGGHLRLDAGIAAPVVPGTPPPPAAPPGVPPLVGPHHAPPPPQQPTAPPPPSSSARPAAAARAPQAPPPPAARPQQQQHAAPPGPPGPPPGAGWSQAAVAALDNVVRVAEGGGLRPSAAALAEASKYAKWTKSALDHDDVTGAVKCLADALKALMPR